MTKTPLTHIANSSLTHHQNITNVSPSYQHFITKDLITMFVLPQAPEQIQMYTNMFRVYVKSQKTKGIKNTWCILLQTPEPAKKYTKHEHVKSHRSVGYSAAVA